MGRDSHRADDSGSAVVDFVLVAGFLVFLVLALLQLALTLQVRNVLIDSAGQGARFGALAGQDPAAAEDRAAALIREELPGRYAEHVSARIARVDGARTVEVQVDSPLPVIGLVGIGRHLTVTGHALAEEP